MIEFAWPIAFAALLLPVVAAILLPPARSTPAALRVPFFATLRDARTHHHASGLRWRRVLAALAFIALTCAAARPVMIGEQVTVPRTGRDVMLAIDISASMDKRDWAADSTRFDVVKRVVGDFISRRHGDRIGVIVFGSRAYIQTPLTFDLESVRQLFTETSVGLAGPATALGDALGLTIKHLRDTDARHKVVVLMSDGAANAGSISADDAVRVAASAGLTVYAIGVGSLTHTGDDQSFDETLLRALSESTGGEFFLGRAATELERVYATIDRLEPAAIDDDIVRSKTELYPWPLGVALAIATLLIVSVTGVRRRSPAVGHA